MAHGIATVISARRLVLVCSAVFPFAINTQHFLVHGADEDLHSQRRVRVVSGTGLRGRKN